jgi:isoleucyl-tRNA synthetase
VIQDTRKEKGCEFTDRIRIGIVTDSPELSAAVEQFRDYIQSETLAVEIVFAPLSGIEAIESKVGDYAMNLFIEVVKSV